jgi:hypothetical protein
MKRIKLGEKFMMIDFDELALKLIEGLEKEKQMINSFHRTIKFKDEIIADLKQSLKDKSPF